jgi:tetratricopeptide (TPR) repeat protein
MKGSLKNRSSKRELPKKGVPGKDQRKDQKTVKQVKRNRYHEWLGLAAMILLGIIIYSDSFNCSFHFDDLTRIVDNPAIRNVSDVKAWWNVYPSRPVGMFTFALNYHFNRLDVQYYHLVNLVIHLINACLVWWLTMLIFSSPALKHDPLSGQKKVIAFFTALLFVSHPLATQSVTYIIQRLTSMAAMFYLLSLALYVKARISDKGNLSKILLFAGSLISAVLAMLTKENAFTLPFAIVLFEFFFLRTKKLSVNFRDYRMILLPVAFLGFILFLLLKFSFGIFRPIPPMLGHAYTVTPLNYLFTQFSVIVKYIQLLFLPINQVLDYDFPLSATFFEIRTVLCFLLLLSLLILAVRSFKRYRIISFGIFWFFLTLSVESGFIPISDVIFEHRTYLPSFGFFLILSSGLCLLLWNKYRYLPISLFVIIIGSYSYMTYERNKVWKDELSLWNDNVAKTPGLSRAIMNRGVAWAGLGQWDMALTDYSKAIEINPEFTDAYANRGVACINLDQWDMAINDFSKAIEIDLGFVKAYYNRGVAYGNRGQYDKAIADYSKAIEINPGYALAYDNRGVAWRNRGEYEKAIADYSKAIEIDPDFAKAYSNRGIAYGYLEQWDKALADDSRAIEIDPGYTVAYDNRGVAYSHLGQVDKAIADFTRAIEIDPKNSKAYIDRGVAYDSIRQYNKAIDDYTMAIGIDPKHTKTYYDRAVAWDNLGQYDKAIADYTMAIMIDPNYTDAWYNRGVAYGNLKQYDKAITDYTRVIMIDPGFTRAYTGRDIARNKLHNNPR